MFTTYYYPHTYSAQAEGNAIINFRFGNICFGFGTKKQLEKRNMKKWYDPFPLTFKFNAHTGQCAMIKLFVVGCSYISIWYTTKGESHKGHHRWDEKGLHIGLFQNGKMPGTRRFKIL